MIERTDQNENAADHVDRRSIAKARRTGMVRLALLWWRWGELNPRPKALKQELLRAQQVFSGRRTPLFPSGQANRQACQSGSFMMHGTRKA